MTKPLAGVTLAEVTSMVAPTSVAIAAAFCGRLAADLGATVTIEPDLAARPLFPAGLRAFVDKGKRVEAADRARVNAIIADRASIEAAAEAGAAECWSSPPVMVAIAASRDVNESGESEYTLSARTGVLDLIGDPRRAPLPLPGHQPAFAAGLAAYTGLAAALFAKTREDGPADRVDVVVEECLTWLNWKAILSESWGLPVPTRQGRLTEWPVLRCADGWVALVYRETDWSALCKLIGDPRLEDIRFDSRDGRTANRVELLEIIEHGLKKFKRRELMRRALDLRLPIGPILEPTDLLKDPQYQVRGVFEMLRLPSGESSPVPRLPALWRDASMTVTA